jgi:hypothetical protein
MLPNSQAQQPTPRPEVHSKEPPCTGNEKLGVGPSTSPNVSNAAGRHIAVSTSGVGLCRLSKGSRTVKPV